MAQQERKKKLIETGIPLKTINEQSAREKSLRHGLPNTLHLYWSRKPLSTARSILFAQLVDDPSSHPEQFPTPKDQDKERKRLYRLMERLAYWENINDGELYREAKKAIFDSNDGKMPSVLDPFAGGGAIPLEAQRLGCEAHGSDLNPLAVILNKALIEIPSRFGGSKSVHPVTDDMVQPCNDTEGLTDDIRYYGRQLRNAAFERVGSLYPTVTDGDGIERTVIAWKWARTVRNPNPANPVDVPLVNSWWLSKRKGHEAWVEPVITESEIQYVIHNDSDGPTGDAEGTITRKGAISIVDGTPIPFEYIRKEAQSGRMGAQLLAVIADGDDGRLYCEPSSSQQSVAEIEEPNEKPQESIPEKALGFRVQAYGFNYWSDLFTNRQLTMLISFVNLVQKIRQQILTDALSAGMPHGIGFDNDGNGAEAYADGITVYLALSISRLTDYNSSICSWNSSRETVRNVFSRQAIPMTWDYAETNPFSEKTGNYLSQLNWVAEAVENVPARPQSEAHQADAATRDYTNVVVSTDPPYYDNIGYSDLSDYFYVWLRPMLKDVLPSATATMLTPKTQELVANPYRHNGKDGAQKFFQDGFNDVFAHICKTARHDVPMTVYYAYKQKNDKNGASTGWYTLLDGLIHSGWEITATWPVRSERRSRMLSIGTNALASSIVLACRPRPEDAPSISMRAFNAILHDELTGELKTLMASGIDPVDLAQAAIGPGISVYSRYSRIREADGSDMQVDQALEIINRMLDEVLGDADVEYDADTRFAVKWYQSYGWGKESSGIADQLARSVDTSPEALVYGGIFEQAGGKARLLRPDELDGSWDPLKDEHVSLWEAAVRMAGILSSAGGADAVASVMAKVSQRLPIEQVKALGFRMYHEAEKRSDSAGAQFFNGLVSMWDDLAGKSNKMIRDKDFGTERHQGELNL